VKEDPKWVRNDIQAYVDQGVLLLCYVTSKVGLILVNSLVRMGLLVIAERMIPSASVGNNNEREASGVVGGAAGCVSKAVLTYPAEPVAAISI
jgi:hypothetical protein